MSDNGLTIRFLEAFEYLKKLAIVKSAKDFADQISISQSLISEAKKGRTNIRYSKIQKITEVFGISKEWLLLGTGSMIPTENNLKKEQTQIIESNYPNNIVELPYIPVNARATFAGTYADAVHEPEETYGVYRQSGYDYTAAQVLEINGDSMEPTLINKEKVLIKELCNSKWEYFTGLAAISFKNMFVVKRITSNFDGILTLSSDNPMGGSFKVKIDDVRVIYTIEHSIYRPIK